jgi:DNA-binding SARP family transcriptional activator
LVVDHPLRERLRGYLMLALHRCGRQADALGAFEEGRVMLSERAGLDLSVDLIDLRNGILRGSVSVSDNAAMWHGSLPQLVDLAMVRAPGR